MDIKLETLSATPLRQPLYAKKLLTSAWKPQVWRRGLGEKEAEQMPGSKAPGARGSS